jgi:hypothetical protein
MSPGEIFRISVPVARILVRVKIYVVSLDTGHTYIIMMKNE